MAGEVPANAAPAPSIVAVYQPISGSGGYVLYSNGMLNAQLGAPFYGDARKSGLTNFSAMAQTYGGYWLINRVGKAYSYGRTCYFGSLVGPKSIAGPLIGAISFGDKDYADGFNAVNSAGKLFRFVCQR